MHRFFIELTTEEERAALQPGSIVNLPARTAHQVVKVLHLMPGEHLALLDNSGDEIICTITRSERSTVDVHVLERRPGKPELPVRLVLCQGLLKSARFEWILEKGTELGVSTFVPMLCRRSMAGLEEAGSSKIQRWQHILQEATEQCGRACLPELTSIRSLEHILNTIPDSALTIMPWEEERHVSLREVLQATASGYAQQPMTVFLFIGPEGGFDRGEVQLARQRGVQVVTLGPRILRAETAALAGIANVMYELEGGAGNNEATRE